MCIGHWGAFYVFSYRPTTCIQTCTVCWILIRNLEAELGGSRDLGFVASWCTSLFAIESQTAKVQTLCWCCFVCEGLGNATGDSLAPCASLCRKSWLWSKWVDRDDSRRSWRSSKFSTKHKSWSHPWTNATLGSFRPHQYKRREISTLAFGASGIPSSTFKTLSQLWLRPGGTPRSNRPGEPGQNTDSSSPGSFRKHPLENPFLMWQKKQIQALQA